MKQEMMAWHWQQLDHLQIICTSLQTDNHASVASLNFYKADALPDINRQHHNTEGNRMLISWFVNQLQASQTWTLLDKTVAI